MSAARTALAFSLLLPVAAFAQRPKSLELEIVTKLGVKTKVGLRPHADNVRGEFYYPPHLQITLDNNVQLTVPWLLVKTMVVKEKAHAVTLRDGTEYIGTPLGGLTTDDGKEYSLASTRTVTVLDPPEVKKRKEPAKVWALKVAGAGESFDAIDAQFLLSLSADSGRFSKTFTIVVDGEKLEGNLTDFDRVSVARNKDKGWNITVRAPGGEDVTGAYEGDRLGTLTCELANGCSALINLGLERHVLSKVDGFTLEIARDSAKPKDGK
jgi:hypothetical protein